MKQSLFKFLMVGMLTLCGSAHAVTCSINVTSVPLSTLYVSGAPTNITGTVSGSCIKQAGDAARPYIYIGINQGEPPAGRAMTRQNGLQLLNYQIYKANFTTGIWSETTGSTSTTVTGGFLYRMANNNTAQTFNYPYYLSIPTPQAAAPAGIYDDLAIIATIRLSDNNGLSTGAILGTAAFGASASIPNSCYFSTSPSSLVLNYTSFTGTAVTGNSTFALSCTFNSSYTLAIGPAATGSALDINYTLALSAASGIGTAAPQNFTVTGTAAANQAGTCASSTCSATNAHTITVTF